MVVVDTQRDLEPSDWVMNKLKRFGKLVGASYEGYEDKVIEILMDVDARRRQAVIGGRRATGSRKRGIKELKGLVSTINYKTRGSNSVSNSKGWVVNVDSMNVKIVPWNVWGLNELDKRLWVKHLLKGWKADIMSLQETKLGLISSRTLRSLWGCHYVDRLFLGSNGASGGILLMWDRRVVEKIEDAVGHYSVSCKFKITTCGFIQEFMDPIWIVIGRVYRMSKRGLRVGGMLHGVWEVINVVRYLTKRFPSASFTSAMYDFSDFISAHDLIDNPLSGGKFTWFNG